MTNECKQSLPDFSFPVQALSVCLKGFFILAASYNVLRIATLDLRHTGLVHATVSGMGIKPLGVNKCVVLGSGSYPYSLTLREKVSMFGYLLKNDSVSFPDII